MKFGFSTGCLWQTATNKEALLKIKSMGCNAIELGLLDFDTFKGNWLDELTIEDFSTFQYVSIHSPKIMYGDNEDTRLVIDKLSRLDELRKLDLIVIHPDIVEDFSVFADSSLPFAFENMDKNKKSFQTPRELDELTKKYGFDKFVLDVNHIFTVDPTMNLAKEFYSLVGDRIVEVQVSGYKTLHDPLAETHQTAILEAIQETSVPIIDEADLPPSLLKAEKDFVLEHLAQTHKSEQI